MTAALLTKFAPDPTIMRSASPVMIAFAVLMMMGTLFLVLIAEWIRRRGQPGTIR